MCLSVVLVVLCCCFFSRVTSAFEPFDITDWRVEQRIDLERTSPLFYNSNFPFVAITELYYWLKRHGNRIVIEKKNGGSKYCQEGN